MSAWDDASGRNAPVIEASKVVRCSNPEPHEGRGHYWNSVSGSFWCIGIPEPDELPLSGMAALRAWMTDDYECNAAEIIMTCTGASYEDDDTPEGQHVINWEYAYEIKLYETGMYGGAPPSSTGDSSWTTYQHTGFGTTMDEAADNALTMRQEHFLEVVAPLRVIPAVDATLT